MSEKISVYRDLNTYDDLISLCSIYYKLYEQMENIVAPLMRRNIGNRDFKIPTKEELKSLLGKTNNAIPEKTINGFILSTITFIKENIGKRAMISASPSTQCSAQFPIGTFRILWDKEIKKYKIYLAGASEILYTSKLPYKIENIQHMILKPVTRRNGELSVSEWEMILYIKDVGGYVINHVDSFKNPKYAGGL